MVRILSYIISRDLRVMVTIVMTAICGSTSLYADHYDRLVIEDLRAEYSSTKDEIRKAYILYDYCLYYQVKNYKVDSVLHYANVLLSFGEKENVEVARLLGHRMLGSQYTRINEFGKGQVHLYESIRLAKVSTDDHNIHDSYNPLAMNYYQQSQLDSSLYYFTKCIEVTPDSLHSKHSAYHIGLGELFEELMRHDKQEEHVLLAYDRAQKADINLDKIIALTYILDYYSLITKDAKSFNQYKKPYDNLMAQFGGRSKKYHANYDFVDNLLFNDRIVFLEEALDDSKRDGYVDGVYFTFIQLQRSYLKNGEYRKCAKIGEEAIAYNDEKHRVKLKFLVEVYHNKWLAESKMNNPNKAIETIKKYYVLKDSLTETNNIEHVNELNIKYETAKKDAQLSAGELKINRSTAQRNYALLLTGLLLTIGYFLWRRLRYKQQESEALNKLQEEQIINLEREKKILSLTSMLEGQEAERTRIAQDLHDGLGGLLSSVRNHFSLIQGEVKKLDSLNVYDRTNSMIDQACNEVRRISHNLMPASLQLNGLVSTIEQYCIDIVASKKLEVHFEHKGILDKNLNENMEIFIYRIFQEAVTNALKHANATNLLVQLGLYDGEITLIIEDDGDGFDLESQKDGIGLKSIKSRVDHLNGQLDLDSKPGSGTTITINIPYEQQ